MPNLNGPDDYRTVELVQQVIDPRDAAKRNFERRAQTLGQLGVAALPPRPTTPPVRGPESLPPRPVDFTVQTTDELNGRLASVSNRLEQLASALFGDEPQPESGAEVPKMPGTLGRLGQNTFVAHTLVSAIERQVERLERL